MSRENRWGRDCEKGSSVFGGNYNLFLTVTLVLPVNPVPPPAPALAQPLPALPPLRARPPPLHGRPPLSRLVQDPHLPHRLPPLCDIRHLLAYGQCHVYSMITSVKLLSFLFIN